MNRAIFINDHGEERKFDVKFCPTYIMWKGRMWALQPNRDRPDEWRYRETTVMSLEQLALDAERVNV